MCACMEDVWAIIVSNKRKRRLKKHIKKCITLGIGAERIIVVANHNIKKSDIKNITNYIIKDGKMSYNDALLLGAERIMQTNPGAVIFSMSAGMAKTQSLKVIKAKVKKILSKPLRKKIHVVGSTGDGPSICRIETIYSEIMDAIIDGYKTGNTIAPISA